MGERENFKMHAYSQINACFQTFAKSSKGIETKSAKRQIVTKLDFTKMYISRQNTKSNFQIHKKISLFTLFFPLPRLKLSNFFFTLVNFTKFCPSFQFQKIFSFRGHEWQRNFFQTNTNDFTNNFSNFLLPQKRQFLPKTFFVRF